MHADRKTPPAILAAEEAKKAPAKETPAPLPLRRRVVNGVVVLDYGHDTPEVEEKPKRKVKAKKDGIDTGTGADES